MELTIIKYNDLDKPNKFIIMAVSDCDELYRVEKIYRNFGYEENFHVGKLLDIRGDKMYQNKTIIGNVDTIKFDNTLLEIIKSQIQLEQDIFRKKTQLKHVEELLFKNETFTLNVY